MKEQIFRKLTSRKFWAAICAAALCVVAACFGEELTPETVEVLKAAVGAGVAYIFGESAVDIFREVAESIKKKDVPSDGTEGADSE